MFLCFPSSLCFMHLKFSHTTIKRLFNLLQQRTKPTCFTSNQDRRIFKFVTTIRQASCISNVGLGFWGLFLFCYCIDLAIYSTLINECQSITSAKYSPIHLSSSDTLPSCSLLPSLSQNSPPKDPVQGP